MCDTQRSSECAQQLLVQKHTEDECLEIDKNGHAMTTQKAAVCLREFPMRSPGSFVGGVLRGEMLFSRTSVKIDEIAHASLG
jgi:hypothetical protein